MVETIGTLFEARAKTFSDHSFLQVPANAARSYHPGGYLCSYGQAAKVVDEMVAKLSDAGYGHGHRIAVLLENRPEMLLVKLALAKRGISWVPVNPDYRPAEVAYLLQDSAAELALVAPELAELMAAGIAESGLDVPTVELTENLPELPKLVVPRQLTNR